MVVGEMAGGRKDRGVRAERGHLETDGDGIVIIAGDLEDPWLLKEVLVVVVDGGWEKHIERSPQLFSVVADGRLLVSIGVILLRKSVYADGGVIGVLRRSSFLTNSTFAEGSAERSGLSCSSDGSF